MISANTHKGIAGSSVTDSTSTHIELTPLVDVIFIVIVFLLLTANVRLLSLPVTVPESEDIPEAVSNVELAVNVTISAESKGWFIDKTYFVEWPLFREELLAKISLNPDVIISIAADQQADVQRFVRVLTLLQQQKISNTHIILQKEN